MKTDIELLEMLKEEFLNPSYKGQKLGFYSGFCMVRMSLYNLGLVDDNEKNRINTLIFLMKPSTDKNPFFWKTFLTEPRIKAIDKLLLELKK